MSVVVCGCGEGEGDSSSIRCGSTSDGGDSGRGEGIVEEPSSPAGGLEPENGHMQSQDTGEAGVRV